ncbi:hypothetical protein IJH26_00005 [Candidatus Saccharibacteria bacterium]|nr:hypothetical protein [Candidatus Saccharibacteria bacterium]
MKKLAILGASAALAAMPVVGVFADNVTTTVDTLTLTVDQGCNIINESTDRTDKTAAFGNVTPGLTAEDGTSPITITCNGAWKLTPSITTALASGANTIPSGATALDGTVSEWALKLTTTAATNNYSGYAAVDGTKVVSDTAAASSLTITPTYKVSIAPGQASGSYTGTVTYTVANN